MRSTVTIFPFQKSKTYAFLGRPPHVQLSSRYVSGGNGKPNIFYSVESVEVPCLHLVVHNQYARARDFAEAVAGYLEVPLQNLVKAEHKPQEPLAGVVRS